MMTKSNKFNQFLSECREKTFAYIHRRFGSLNDDECKDVFQEASVALYENIVNGNYVIGNATLYTYFLSIVNNQTLKALKRMNKSVALDTITTMKVTEDNPYQPDRVDELLNLSYEGEDEVMRGRLQDVVQEIMRNLSEKCQALLWGHYGNDMAWDVLADMNGLANANVAKSTANRCRNQFREKYDDIKTRMYANR